MHLFLVTPKSVAGNEPKFHFSHFLQKEQEP